MSAVATVVRAIFGYCFLILITRIVGRRPGGQLTPFEFVLVFYLGGLTLTSMVADEISMTNAICQIVTIALCHYGLTWLRARSPRLALMMDGTPMVLLANGEWRIETMKKMRVQDDDVMAAARAQGLRSLDQIDMAVLERTGEISVLKKKNED